ADGDGHAAPHPGGGVVEALEDETLGAPAQRVVEELVMGVGGLEVRPLYRAAEPSVVEPLAVPRPRDTGELDARDCFREVMSGPQVAQVDVLEVGATRGGGVGQHEIGRAHV